MRRVVNSTYVSLDGVIYGFGPVGEALLQNGLLDELRLWVHPVLAGVGEPCVVLSYAPGGKD